MGNMHERAEMALKELWPQWWSPTLKDGIAPYLIEIMAAFAKLEINRYNYEQHKTIEEIAAEAGVTTNDMAEEIRSKQRIIDLCIKTKEIR